MIHPGHLEYLYELRQAEFERDFRQRELLRQALPPVERSVRVRLAARMIALACWLAPAVREQVAVRPA
ncbi:MAG TPA: hypothetical protein VGP33_05630 [Chloroflexota bacterium]|jgi:hypothetical protein|nr:hypothetical protein [Chloroflexota bacterium]